MATEYGIDHPQEGRVWFADKGSAQHWAIAKGVPLLAREVSEPRIVSIRA